MDPGHFSCSASNWSFKTFAKAIYGLKNMVLKVFHNAAITKLRCYFIILFNGNVSVPYSLILREKMIFDDASWWWWWCLMMMSDDVFDIAEIAKMMYYCLWYLDALCHIKPSHNSDYIISWKILFLWCFILQKSW